MAALDRLRELLRDMDQPPAAYRQRLNGGTGTLTKVLASLEQRFQEGDQCRAGADQIRRSLRRFVELERLETLRDAQRVCFGLASPVSEQQPSVFEDRRLFPKVLAADTGTDQWLGQPRAFRRCFRGLTASYFSFDGTSRETSRVARRNWQDLRDYLHDRVETVHAGERDPDWVGILDRYQHVLSESPFGDLPRHALAGDHALLQWVFDALLIDGTSWFQRDLLLAQVNDAASRDDVEFVELAGRLIALIEGSPLIRDEALAVMLDRYEQCRDPVEHKGLCDAAVDWWGNPWLPSNELHWGRVTQGTRDMVAQWLQKEFIKAFFSKLATDSADDRRRARFWSRYLGAFTDMKFGLGRRTLYSRDRDFKMLVKKMKGLYGPIDSSAVGGDAFVMTLGRLVVVEFSGFSNAMYGYDATGKLPFVVDESRSLKTAVDAPNSLKHSAPSSALKLVHQDNVLGYGKWEDRFAAELEAQFGIVRPDGRKRTTNGSARQATRRARDASPPPMPEAFYAFAKANRLSVEDLRHTGGNLWVRTGDHNREVSARLRTMGFSYKARKGWWKAKVNARA